MMRLTLEIVVDVSMIKIVEVNYRIEVGQSA